MATGPQLFAKLELLAKPPMMRSGGHSDRNSSRRRQHVRPGTPQGDQDRPTAHLTREHLFGMLVTHSAQGLDANRLPFEFDSTRGSLGTLQAHTARANPFTPRIVDDEKFVRGVVARLTRRHEAAEPKPWKMGDAPHEYLDRMLSMVVGIEVQLTRL